MRLDMALRLTVAAMLVVILSSLVPAAGAMQTSATADRQVDDIELASTVVRGDPTGANPNAESDQLPDGVIAIPTESSASNPAPAMLDNLTWDLRHDFSLAPSPYPVPYSCYGINGGYYCRAVYGYEEGGSGDDYDVDFLVTIANIVDESSPTTGQQFGAEIVYDGGAQYEGCEAYDSTYRICDYWTPHGSRREFENDPGYWIEMFRDWASYTVFQQGNCAANIVGMWVSASDFNDVGVACFSSPFDPQ